MGAADSSRREKVTWSLLLMGMAGYTVTRLHRSGGWKLGMKLSGAFGEESRWPSPWVLGPKSARDVAWWELASLCSSRCRKAKGETGKVDSTIGQGQEF